MRIISNRILLEESRPISAQCSRMLLGRHTEWAQQVTTTMDSNRVTEDLENSKRMGITRRDSRDMGSNASPIIKVRVLVGPEFGLQGGVCMGPILWLVVVVTFQANIRSYPVVAWTVEPIQSWFPVLQAPLHSFPQRPLRLQDHQSLAWRK